MKLTLVLALAACHSLPAESRPLFFETLGSIASGTMSMVNGAASGSAKVATGLAATGINALSGTAGVATGVVTGLANTGIDTLRNIPNGPAGMASAMAGGLTMTGLDAVSGGMGVAEGVAVGLANTGSDAAVDVTDTATKLRDFTVKGWTQGKKLLMLAKMCLKHPAMLKRMLASRMG